MKRVYGRFTWLLVYFLAGASLGLYLIHLLVREFGPVLGRVDAALDAMYRRERRWWLAVSWRMLFRLLMGLEVAFVFWWMGAPVWWWAVVALESVAQAARVAAVLIPAALGAQETVIMAAGLLLGCPVEVMFVLAVVKRIRELVIGGAGLVVWQIHEARILLRRRVLYR